MSISGGANGKWIITTPKGKTIEIQADYITTNEAKIISALIDYLDLENYELNISIDLKSGTGKITIKRKQ